MSSWFFTWRTTRTGVGPAKAQFSDLIALATQTEMLTEFTPETGEAMVAFARKAGITCNNRHRAPPVAAQL